MVRSLSCCHFSKASDKAAGAAQSKSTFIAEYQNGLSFNSLCPKGYSQGPKDGKQGQETLNQLHDKHKNLAKKEKTAKDQKEKLTEEMKEQPGEEKKKEHEQELMMKEKEDELKKEEEDEVKKEQEGELKKKEEEDELKKEEEDEVKKE